MCVGRSWCFVPILLLFIYFSIPFSGSDCLSVSFYLFFLSVTLSLPIFSAYMPYLLSYFFVFLHHFCRFSLAFS